MPIGVPKVEYRLPGEPEADWIDLYNCLYRERMLFLCQDLGDEVANQLISLMLYLNAEDPSQPFFMYINSLGGSVTCGIGVYDIMRYLESGITTICMGTASSMASFVLAGGTYGRRLSLPHGRIMIHQPEGGSDGQASEILSESSEVSRIRKQIGLIYANRTQQSIERIARDMDRDQFMSADEAKSYGLIDFVARTVTDPGVDMLKLLSDASITPKPFRDLAAAQSMDEARQAIRDLPESQQSSDSEEISSFRTFPVNGLDTLEDMLNQESIPSPPKTFLQEVRTELQIDGFEVRENALTTGVMVDWTVVDDPDPVDASLDDCDDATLIADERPLRSDENELFIPDVVVIDNNFRTKMARETQITLSVSDIDLPEQLT
jgi:ATP-dependent Clp protease protease subunit